MIYIFVGPSCAGKTTIIMNSFLKGKRGKEIKDILPMYETDTAFLLGRWLDERRSKGLDRISRAQIPEIGKQIIRLIPKGKDIVLDGDKAVSDKLFSELSELGGLCQLYWIRCTEKTTLERNRKNGSTLKDGSIKAVATKAKNIFWRYARKMNGAIIDTDNITDWGNFSLKTANIIHPCKKAGKTRDDFAVFILTHGRANNVVTMDALKRGVIRGNGTLSLTMRMSRKKYMRKTSAKIMLSCSTSRPHMTVRIRWIISMITGLSFMLEMRAGG